MKPYDDDKPDILTHDTDTDRYIGMRIPHKWAQAQLDSSPTGRSTIYLGTTTHTPLTDEQRAAMLQGSPFTRPMSPRIKES